jgi:hypothetical protein
MGEEPYYIDIICKYIENAKEYPINIIKSNTCFYEIKITILEYV